MDCCIARLSEFAKVDPHAKENGYFVRSLYYDDMIMSAYEDKEDGVCARHKYRIRAYDHDNSVIFLEKKIKEGSYVRKESIKLSIGDFNSIIMGETAFLLEKEERVAFDFAIRCRTDNLHPEVIIDYCRIPFIYEYGDVRITFDMSIKASVPDYDFFSDGGTAYSVLSPDNVIMEIKYTQFLPDVFRNIMPDNSCRIATSKYVMSVDTLRRLFVK